MTSEDEPRTESTTKLYRPLTHNTGIQMQRKEIHDDFKYNQI